MTGLSRVSDPEQVARLAAATPWLNMAMDTVMIGRIVTGIPHRCADSRTP